MYIAGRVRAIIFLMSSNQCHRPYTLPRVLGMSPISRDVIGLVSRLDLYADQLVSRESTQHSGLHALELTI